MRRSSPSPIFVVALVFLLGCGGAGKTPQLPPGDAMRGEPIFAAAAGCGCHTPMEGPVGAGGREIRTSLGTFYGTNITPDVETGIGRWTDAEIDAAVRGGAVRGEGAEAPVMPYYRYGGMSDQDAADLIAYLRALPPVRRENTPHDIRVPAARWAFWAWRQLFSGEEVAAPAPADAVGRGRYLADHVAICGDCHTERNALGVRVTSRYLAGTEHGPEGQPVPNITPDSMTGIGNWTAGDIAVLLARGIKPDGGKVEGLMAEAVEGHGGGPGYSRMSPADREAIGAYLRTVPPVANDVGGE